MTSFLQFQAQVTDDANGNPLAAATYTVGPMGSVVTLPSPGTDAFPTLACTISNAGPAAVGWFWGIAPGGHAIGAPSAIMLPPGKSILITDPALNAVTTATIQAAGGGATVAFARGEVVAVTTFTAAGVAQ